MPVDFNILREKINTFRNTKRGNWETIHTELTDYFKQFNTAKIKLFITADNITKEMIEFSEIAGFYLANAQKRERDYFINGGLSTGQLRNFFTEVKRIELRPEKDRLMLLKPKLEYIASKQPSLGMDKFREIMRPCLDELISTSDDAQKKFTRFTNLLESILAYHKAYGGKD